MSLNYFFSLFRLHEECHAFRSGDDFAAGDLQPTEIADWSGGGETGLTSIIPRSRLHSIWFSLKPNHDRAAHTHFLNSDSQKRILNLRLIENYFLEFKFKYKKDEFITY